MAKKKHKPAKAKDDGEMSAATFKKVLDKLGLSVYASGKVVGLSLRQSQRVAAGESPVPRPVAKLINLLAKGRISVEETKAAG